MLYCSTCQAINHLSLYGHTGCKTNKKSLIIPGFFRGYRGFYHRRYCNDYFPRLSPDGFVTVVQFSTGYIQVAARYIVFKTLFIHGAFFIAVVFDNGIIIGVNVLYLFAFFVVDVFFGGILQRCRQTVISILSLSFGNSFFFICCYFIDDGYCHMVSYWNNARETSKYFRGRAALFLPI